MRLFGKKKNNTEINKTKPETATQSISMKDSIHDMIISTNGIALFDYNGMTSDQDQKVREYAKQIGIKYHVHKNSLFLAAIKETKFENLSDVIANNKLFSVIYFDNMKQLKDFINFVDSMNIPNGRNESRVFAHMYIE